jgi:glutathione S-transferase
MQIRLISFKICPFVQRAVLTLLHNNMPYNVTYIDLADPPAWFKKISPFGKVPVLMVDDEHVIFESAVIDEFLNDVSPNSLLPTDPLQRAIDRSWIEFGTSVILDFSAMIHSNDARHYEDKQGLVKKQMGSLERRLGPGPYFNADAFSLVDIAYAPLFMRTDMLRLGEVLYPRDSYPKTHAWAQRLLALPELVKSVADEFETLFKSHLCAKAPYAAERLGL